MCGRFDNHLPKMHGWSEILGHWPDVPLSYNVAPSANIAVFTQATYADSGSHEKHSEEQYHQEQGDLDVFKGHAMRWGMIPSWSAEFASSYATFNARIETVAEKPTFRKAWRKEQRCLIPMAGYYEWQSIVGPDGKKVKQPFYITDKTVGGLVAGGLYETWGDESERRHSCTMITRAADSGLSNIHARMPVLMTPQSAMQWLDYETSEAAQFLQEIESPDVVFWPVSRAVGNVRNNDETLSLPIDTLF